MPWRCSGEALPAEASGVGTARAGAPTLQNRFQLVGEAFDVGAAEAAVSEEGELEGGEGNERLEAALLLGGVDGAFGVEAGGGEQRSVVG